MTTTTVIPAGYIITDETAVWGVGATEAEAWANFHQGMETAGVRVVSDDEDTSDDVGTTTRRSGYGVEPATAALMELIADAGGQVRYAHAGRVACTIDEWTGE